jgi:hypothetical protein
MPTELVSITFSLLYSLHSVFPAFFFPLVDGELTLLLNLEFLYLYLLTNGNAFELTVVGAHMPFLYYFCETVPSLSLVNSWLFYFGTTNQHGLK